MTHLRLVSTTVQLRDGRTVKAMVEPADPLVSRLALMKAAPALMGALRDAPEPPVGLAQMTPDELLEWGCSYLSWWRDRRGGAIQSAERRA